MRHILAYMMLLIFSFQVLPIKEIGRILFKSQLTEEIHEDCEEGGEMKLNELPFFKAHTISYVHREVYLERKLNLVIHQATLIAHQHFPDIFAPPPNA